MIEHRIKEIHNVSHPGEAPKEGDSVEVETVGGFVTAVDPITRKATTERKKFVVTRDGLK